MFIIPLLGSVISRNLGDPPCLPSAAQREAQYIVPERMYFLRKIRTRIVERGIPQIAREPTIRASNTHSLSMTVWVLALLLQVS